MQANQVDQVNPLTPHRFPQLLSALLVEQELQELKNSKRIAVSAECVHFDTMKVATPLQFEFSLELEVEQVEQSVLEGVHRVVVEFAEWGVAEEVEQELS